jgi:hypothetical protein
VRGPPLGIGHFVGDSATQPDDLDLLDDRVRTPSNGSSFNSRAFPQETVQIFVGDAAGGPTAPNLSQVDTGLDRPAAHRRRGDGPLAWRARQT